MLQEFLEERVPDGKLGAGLSVCFICQDASVIYRELKSRGLEAQMPFVGNGMWMTSMSDPDGYSILFESPTDAPEDSEYRD